MNKFAVKGKVKSINGTVLMPEVAGLRFVLSNNNLAGKVDGHPLYPLFDKKWTRVKVDAKGWYTTKTGSYVLGAIETTAVQSDTWVIHMLCQDKDLVFSEDGLKKCLKEVVKMAKFEKATVHVSSLLLNVMPELEKLLESDVADNGVSVYLYFEQR